MRKDQTAADTAASSVHRSLSKSVRAAVGNVGTEAHDALVGPLSRRGGRSGLVPRGRTASAAAASPAALPSWSPNSRVLSIASPAPTRSDHVALEVHWRLTLAAPCPSPKFFHRPTDIPPLLFLNSQWLQARKTTLTTSRGPIECHRPQDVAYNPDYHPHKRIYCPCKDFCFSVCFP